MAAEFKFRPPVFQQLTFHLLGGWEDDTPPPTSEAWINLSINILENMPAKYLCDLKELKLVNLGMDPKRVDFVSRFAKLQALTWVLGSNKQVSDPLSVLVNVFEMFNYKDR